MTYSERLKSRLETTGSALCVGLDPRPDMTKGGADAVPEFLRRVIGETAEFAAAFKPNIAYFEAMGLQGLGNIGSIIGRNAQRSTRHSRR
jgi:orotidine-5'-phosphate decarboxylase